MGSPNIKMSGMGRPEAQILFQIIWHSMMIYLPSLKSKRTNSRSKKINKIEKCWERKVEKGMPRYSFKLFGIPWGYTCLVFNFRDSLPFSKDKRMPISKYLSWPEEGRRALKVNSLQSVIVCSMLDPWACLWGLHVHWSSCSWMLMWFTVVQVSTQLGATHLSGCTTPELSTRCIHQVNYSHIQAWYIGPPHILLMYCWYMRLRQLCVIYAGITIDARTGHTLVGLH